MSDHQVALCLILISPLLLSKVYKEKRKNINILSYVAGGVVTRYWRMRTNLLWSSNHHTPTLVQSNL